MKDNIKKLQKYAKLVKLAATVATVAMAIYTLIPKNEKIEGLDTDALALSNMNTESQEAEQNC